jgi:hypothetical protein
MGNRLFHQLDSFLGAEHEVFLRYIVHADYQFIEKSGCSIDYIEVSVSHGIETARVDSSGQDSPPAY